MGTVAMITVAIVVAAGRGVRAGDGLPKQYRSAGGLPVLTRTLAALLAHPRIDRVLCAINPDDKVLYDQAVAALPVPPQGRLAPPSPGGSTRQQSVFRALETASGLGPVDLCLVHDAARPFIGAALIDRAVAAGTVHGAAVPGLAVSDTIKRIDAEGTVVETPPRAALRAVQTPQAFRFEPLLAAHRRAAAKGLVEFTDDGQLAEWAGMTVHVFDGEAGNVKITHPQDFEEAERRLGSGHLRAATYLARTGSGFDVHVFGEGDHVWIGGVRIPHSRGVLAHSDGDVVLHALTDALLGAICDGDIGVHFPPSDPQWRGASSDRFLAYAADKVRARGGLIDHLDSTLLCESPRVGPHREAIRARIAEIVGIPVSRVSIKATTTERVGFVGREEGLAAQAVATIRLPDSD